MLAIPQMVLIGGAERRVGKTLFSCSLIRRLSPSRRLVAVKATRGGEAHHALPPDGGEGQLLRRDPGRYWIWEEKNTSSGKDTSRMLAAGAARAFWFSWQEPASEGLGALLEIIGPDTPIVCEGGGLRTVVLPGLFFLLRRSGSNNEKGSFRVLKECENHLVTYDGNDFDLDIGNINFNHDRWRLR